MGVCDDRKQPRLALLEALSNGRASLRYAAGSGQQQRPVPLKQVELIVALSASSSSDLAHALTATSSSSTELALAWMESQQQQSPAQSYSLTSLGQLLRNDPTPQQLAALWLSLQGPQDLWRWKAGLATARSSSELRQLRRSRRSQQLEQAGRQGLLDAIAARSPITALVGSKPSQELLRGLKQLAGAEKPEEVSLAPELHQALQRAGYDGSAQVLQQVLVDLGLLQAGQPLRLLGSAWESNSEVELPTAQSDPQRRDLTHLSCFSIDSASTQEVDDAIGLERRDGDLWIWVHIADPHQWLEPGDRLDLEAQRRGSTLYLSGGAMPMFPMAVARDCMSLRPMRRCGALSVGVLLDADGAITAVEPCRSWVKVSYGLTYEDADDLIELAPPEDPDLAELAELLKRRTAWRENQGALLMEQAEGRLFRNSAAELALEITEPGLARSCVSEAMILAGAAMAEWSSQHELAMPFRVQAGSSQDNAEANQWPQGPVRWAQQRRGLSRSRLQSKAEPHGSLGLPMYLQWTSPIRRYSDLLAHRQWLQFSGHVEGEPLDAEAIGALLQRLDQGQREASLIARQDQRMALLEWLAGPIPQWPQPAILLSWLREDNGIALVRLEAWAMELPAQIEAGLGLGDQLFIQLERVDPASDLLRLKGIAG